MLIACLSGILLFTIYVVIAIIKFGVPKSLSDTFYKYGGKPKGYIFTAALWITVFLLMPAWFSCTPDMFTFSTFLSAGGLLLVGAAPMFKSADAKWHEAFAIICAVFALLWQILVGQYWELATVLMIVLAISIPTKTFKSSRTFYLEMVAFYSTFISIIVQYLTK